MLGIANSKIGLEPLKHAHVRDRAVYAPGQVRIAHEDGAAGVDLDGARAQPLEPFMSRRRRMWSNFLRPIRGRLCRLRPGAERWRLPTIDLRGRKRSILHHHIEMEGELGDGEDVGGSHRRTRRKAGSTDAPC